MSGLMLGWYDPDRKRTADDKLNAACDRYKEKFGAEANLCLCNPVEASFLLGRDDMRIEARGYIARNTFYIGREADAEPVEVSR